MSQVKRRATAMRPQQARRQFLQMEQLEERSLLAGNVTASDFSGYLYLTGDSQSNSLTLTRVGTTGLQITPQAGTTINGSANPLTLSNVSRGLFANLGNGDDVLELHGSTTNNLQLSGFTTILTGNGDDTVRFVNFTSDGGLLVDTGNGNDTVSGALDPAAPGITAGGLRVNGAAIITTGNGDDNVSLRNSAFSSVFRLDTGRGNDTADIRNSEFRSRFTAFYDVSGNDTLNNAGNTITGSPFISGFETNTSISGPTAGNDAVTLAEGGNLAINVLTNDAAAAGGTLNIGSVAIVTGPLHGTAVVNSNGTITYTNGGGEFATDSFTYTVRDSQGNISNTATVNVSITNTNDLPLAVADTMTVNAGTATTLNLGANDSDAEGRLNLGSIVIVQQPTNGTVTVGTNGNVSYTSTVPGATSDSFTYTIADQDGGVSTAATVNLVIVAAGAPTIAPIANQSTSTGTATSAIAVTVNDSQTPAGSLYVTATSSNTTLVPNSGIVLGGSGSNRTLTITPAANQTGTSTITVSATDGDNNTTTTSFVLTVGSQTGNSAPTIGAISNVVTTQNTATGAIAVTVNDAETAAGSLNVTATSSNTTLVPNSNIVLGGSGSNRTLTITPATNQTGATAITVTATDANNVSTTRTFVVTVNAPVVPNTAPTISSIANVTTNQNTATGAIAVTVNDAETAAGSLNVTATSSNPTLVPNSSIVLGGSGSNRTLTITPAANQTGTSTITVTATDANNSTTTTTFLLTVTAPNTAPTIGTIANVTTNQNTATGAIAVTVNDAETAAGSLNVTATSSNPTLIPNSNIVLGGSGSNRTLTITPAANQSGAAAITVTATDANNVSTTQTFVVTVNAQNTAPTIGTIANLSTNEDTATGAIAVTVNDAETAAGSLVVTASSSNTALVPNGNIVVGGSGSNRTLTITPTANLAGASTITVTATDANNVSTVSTFVLTVTPQNDSPTIGAIANQSTNEDTATSTISVNVSDPETAAGSLTVTATSDNPTLVPNANIVVGGTGSNRTLLITPALNQAGTANITVTASDPNGGTTSSTFALTVNAQNDLPTIGAIANQSINEDTATGAIAVTVNDTETAAGSLTVSTSSSNTTLIPNANIVVGGSGSNRTLTITPAANQSGTATITVTATDANSGTTTSTFVVSVAAQNDLPTIAPIVDVSTNEDVAVTPFTISLGDVENPNGLTVTATSSNPSIVANSGVAITGTGTTRTVTITPVANATGSANVTITVNDGNGGTVSDTFAVNIAAANDAPLAVDDSADINYADASTIALMFAGNVLTNDTDVDTGTTLNVTALGSGTVGQSIQMTYGDLTVNSNGSYTYTIDPALVDAFMAGDDLVETLNYTVSDGVLSDSGTLTINLHIT